MNDIWWRESYAAIQNQVGTVELQGWTRIELRGADRARLLNSLGTNRLDDLAPGQGRETFFANAKGRVVAHGIVVVSKESTSFITSTPHGDAVASHFDRYVVREDVQVADRSEQTALWYVCGRQAIARLEDNGIAVPQATYGHESSTIGGTSLTVCRVEITGPAGFLVIAAREDARAVAQTLARLEGTSCVREAFEAARIAWGWPLDGVDILPDSSFPQEIGRDAQAVSYTKGCYLGQETVARIDSRGHVNRKLVAVRFPGARTAESAMLLCGGSEIGKTTSMGFSPELDCPIALAYIRSEHAAPGTRIDSSIGPGEVMGFQAST